jgi:hypothetical protein
VRVNRHFGGKYRPHLQGKKKAGFLLRLFFDPEDGGDMFLRNVSWLNGPHGVKSQKMIPFIFSHICTPPYEMDVHAVLDILYREWKLLIYRAEKKLNQNIWRHLIQNFTHYSRPNSLSFTDTSLQLHQCLELPTLVSSCLQIWNIVNQRWGAHLWINIAEWITSANISVDIGDLIKDKQGQISHQQWVI